MIHLVSTWSEEFEPLARLTWFNNKLPYATANGYAAHSLEHKDPSKIAWDRLLFLRDRMAESAEGDYFFFSGTDAFITRLDYKIERFIQDDADFICCIDPCRCIFGDCLLIRNCQATRDLITNCVKIIGWSCRDEQFGFSMLLSSSKTQQEWLSKIKGHIDTPEFYERAERLLNPTSIKVKVRSPFQSPKIAGDLAWIHDGYRGIVPKFLEWDEDTFMLHMGGKPLHFRLGLIPILMEQMNQRASSAQS